MPVFFSGAQNKILQVTEVVIDYLADFAGELFAQMAWDRHGLILKDGSSTPEPLVVRGRPSPLRRHSPTGRTAGRMISNLADESLPGTGQMSQSGQQRTPRGKIERAPVQEPEPLASSADKNGVSNI